MTNICSEEAMRAAYYRARRLGALEAYNDCVGGDLTSSHDASDEQRAAVAEYIRLARERYAYIYGPLLREYIDRSEA